MAGTANREQRWARLRPQRWTRGGDGAQVDGVYVEVALRATGGRAEDLDRLEAAAVGATLRTRAGTAYRRVG